MKMRSRLTALVLAVLMLISTAAPALAADALPLSVYQSMVDSAADQATSQPVIDEGGQVYDLGDTAQPVASGYDTTVEVTLAAGEGEQTVALPVNGKVLLTADIAAGQWQVQVGDQWVNMHGETDSTIEVTFAKVQSLFVMNNAAKLRFISADGSAVSNVANVGLDYSVQTLEEDVAMPMMYKARALNANAGVALAAEGEEETPTTVMIEIAYEFANGEPAANSYTATIGYNTDLTTSVIQLPKVVGYLPTCAHSQTEGVLFVTPDPDTNFNGTIQLSLKKVTTDLKFTVVYEPTFVDFKVEHYLMGFDAKQETAVHQEDADQIITGKKTGDPVGEGLAKTTYSGYRALWYDDTTEIAADGSTVIKVYYERNWYLMLFDLDGGYGVEPIYAQYGAPIQIGIPTKPGYSFLGWAATADGDADATLPPATMPCCDSTDGKLTYYAKWDANDTATVTVVFWGETPNCSEDNKEYDYLGSGTLSANVGESFTYNNENTTFQICGQEEHTHDQNCVLDCGKEEHLAHTLTDDCYTLKCTQTPHNHDTAGCTVACTHVHTVDCYATDNGQYSLRATDKPDDANTPTSNGVVTYETGSWYNRETHYYLYIDGVWYCAQRQQYGNNWYSNDEIGISLKCSHTHSDLCYTCGIPRNDHVHTIEAGCYELSCTKEIHQHTALCYSCGLGEHTHTDECWKTGSGLDANLWTLVATETVTVAPDGTSIVNVKYDRTKFTITFNYNYSGGNYNSTSTITDKWGADIGERFLAVNDSANSVLWSESSSGDDPWTSYLQIMPQENVNYYCRYSSTTSQTAEYYTETLNDGEYELEYSVTAYYDSYLSISKEDFYPMEGYTYSHGTDGSGEAMAAPGSYGRFDGAKFYYTRNAYVLDFNNGYSIVKSENVKYEAPLETYETYVPDAPSIYEEGSVRFAGWYLNPQCTGEEYDLTSHKMPAANLILYAKWEPVVHDVTVYIHLEDVGVKDPLIVTFQVTHNEFVPEGTFPSKAEMEELVGLTFIGWFYERTNEDGTISEVAFDPDNMPVKNDMDVYAKWSYNDPITFTVYYRLADENGNAIQAKDENGNLLFDENNEPVYVEVAEPLHSKAMYGTTITVAAKTGDELYKDYRKGYFPHPPSHSVELEIREDGKENEYVFLYTYAESVPYLVKYIKVDADGNPVLDEDGNAVEVAAEKYVAKNADTVVTENYVRVPGYMPDEYQKRLIVMYGGTTEDDGDYVSEADKGENIIYFYYKEDLINAFWTVTHYIEPVGGVTDEKPWQQFGLPLSQSGVITEEQTASPLDIEGFTYTAELTEVDLYQKDGSMKTVVPAELKQVLPDGGMDYRLYYKRNKYPVKVQYMIDGTTTQLADPELVKEADGTTVSTFEYQSSVQVSTDKTFEGYKLVSANPQTLYSVAVDGTTLDTIQYNVLTFYYAEKESTFNYVVVGTDGCGTVDLIDTDDEPAISTSETVTMISGTPVGATAVSTNTDYFVFEGWYSDAACTEENLLSPNASYVPTKAEGQELWPETSTFYAKFVEQPVTITYKVVGPDGCGTVDVNDDAVTAAAATVTETIANRVSGTALGATAAPSSNVYKFVGWYTDAACNTPVVAADGTVTNNVTFVPAKEAANAEAVPPVPAAYEAATFYAKFDYNVATLTIKKTGMNDYETAVFLVTAVTEDSTEAKTFYVSVPNGKSVTIDKVVIGTDYSVVEQGDWTWRYSSTATNASGKIAPGGSTAEFTNTQNKFKWLDHENLEHNVFGTPNNQ